MPRGLACPLSRHHLTSSQPERNRTTTLGAGPVLTRRRMRMWKVEVVVAEYEDADSVVDVLNRRDVARYLNCELESITVTNLQEDE